MSGAGVRRGQTVPRDIVHAAGHSRERSLGHLANAWVEHFVRHGPGDISGQPVRHGQEYYDFVVDCYGLTGDGKLLYDSAFLSRPKGCDKSGLGARFALFEGLGPCRFAGFATGGEVFEDPWDLGFNYEYRPGEPMGKPVHNALIRIMATEETQTGNVYDSIYQNLSDEQCPLSHVPGVTPGLKETHLPSGGRIIASTAAAASKDGGKETFVVFDETHLYDTPILVAMYATVTRNLRKRKATAGTWYLETTTMFAKGAESVAEQTYTLAGQIRDGLTRSDRLLFDHRYGECDDLSSEEMLRAAILEAFGEAIEWNDIDSIVEEFWDPRKTTTDSRRFFLNAPTDTFDAWITAAEWMGRQRADRVIDDGEMITLGFDGSRSRKKGVTDATALIACCVSDGFLFELGTWEQPTGPAGVGWQVPTVEVDAAVDNAFVRFTVVGFYGDPAKWESYIAKWEATYGKRLRAKVTREHPIEFWMVGGHALRTVRALEQFHSAVLDDELSHSGYVLTRHVLNCRRRPTRSGLTVAKENPDSPRKIDAAIAAVLAFQARTDAIAAGVLDAAEEVFVPRRVR